LKKTTERYADVLRSMGYSVNLSHTLRPLVEDKSGIGFAPFAQHRGKMMPLEKSFELVRELAKSEHIYFLEVEHRKWRFCPNGKKKYLIQRLLPVN
jgi:hypothetical protein